jgi:glycerol-3-phosphate acyltransferase PlsY
VGISQASGSGWDDGSTSQAVATRECQPRRRIGSELVDDVPLALAAASIALSYLVGTLPTAQLVGRRVGVDPTQAGSGNPGASNVYRLGGRRAGFAVLLLDMLKGAVPAAAGLAVGGRPLAVACGLAAVVGHVLPATRRFRGGKGVATAGGFAIVVWPVPSAVLAVVFLVVARLLRIASVGSLSMAAGLPVLVALTGRPAWEVAAAAALSLIVVVRHRENIRRLGRGEERPIRTSPLVPPPPERPS